MTIAPDPIVSGVAYVVREVGGRRPADLEDFTGHVSMTVEGSTGRHVVRGQGFATADAARVHEKSDDGVGKDTRTWTVRAQRDGSFAAATD
ncbi:hypothetical protein Q9R32_07715 [Actinotalea sp. AC32]|nr:hypothetical protein [Actinotalea sp. AC32]